MKCFVIDICAHSKPHNYETLLQQDSYCCRKGYCITKHENGKCVIGSMRTGKPAQLPDRSTDMNVTLHIGALHVSAVHIAAFHATLHVFSLLLYRLLYLLLLYMSLLCMMLRMLLFYILQCMSLLYKLFTCCCFT